MASAWTVYSHALLAEAEGNIDLATDTFNLILVTDAYTPAVDTDATFASVSGAEVSGGGYTAGGKTLASNSLVLSGPTVTFTATAPPWSAPFTATFRYAVIVRRAGLTLVPGDLLLCFSDVGGGGPITAPGGTATVTMNASGIFTITHSP